MNCCTENCVLALINATVSEGVCLFSVIDTKEGFLNEWWTVFYDMYSLRTSELKPQEAKAEAAPVQVN